MSATQPTLYLEVHQLCGAFTHTLFPNLHEVILTTIKWCTNSLPSMLVMLNPIGGRSSGRCVILRHYIPVHCRHYQAVLSCCNSLYSLMRSFHYAVSYRNIRAMEIFKGFNMKCSVVRISDGRPCSKKIAVRGRFLTLTEADVAILQIDWGCS